MKHSLKLTIAIVASCLTSLVFAADATTSMRGIDVAAPSPAPAVKDYAGKRPGTEAPVARTFSTQPPVIPHAVENFDEINLEENQCMDCHSAATHEKKKSTKDGR
ncbi:nitrate reductase cytochrome c-type subunit [Candidatus Accumulibacter phosphatis]|uniref:nitrate reductase cytochrome c-type subunit n=1 Tax=Candidatus Accumulibacter phosphatis TaxID=327160 RepID=UPI0020BF1BDC|nr:nitrate reductase cytochrome c-type subunit [Candidatus Accumulibacter phosphatis]